MDGLINLYKPVGLTSARALKEVRTITGQRKSGHAGTLDPEAEGVLVLCLGRGTKLVELLMDQPKVYRTRARLDVTSKGYDREGGLTPVEVARPPTEEQVRAALRQFEGEIQQVPPAFSALKIGGRAAYELARAGCPPVLPPRKVRIYWLHLWGYAWPEVDFEVACGRGTYIRALIRDIGAALQTGGCITALTRTAVGPLEMRTSWSLERLARGAPEEYLWAWDAARKALAASDGPPPRPT